MVPVYELGRFADGRPYFTMKLVKGSTLADLLAERPDPAEDRGKFLQIFLQVCQTVAYAHLRGVIHRDIKPSNVMVGAFGEVLVMDWGLAKVLPRGGIADELKAHQASRERLRTDHSGAPTVINTARSGSGAGSETLAGSVMGTPAFMPPEQAGGEIDKIDERADVFGLGAVLCVVLTGVPPYVANSPEATRLMAIRGELEGAHVRLKASGSDAELVELCTRCLRAERDARPRNADEVAGAVARYLAGVEERAKRAEVARAAAAAEAKEQRKRRRVQLALAASVGLILLGGGAFGWWWDRIESQKRAEALVRQTEDEKRAAEERARVARNADAVAALIGHCESLLRAGNAIQAPAILAEIDRRLADTGTGALRDRVERCRTDLTALRELNAIDVFRWTAVENRIPDGRALAARWRAALSGYELFSGPTEGAVRRLSESLVREPLAGGSGSVAGLRPVRAGSVGSAGGRSGPVPRRGPGRPHGRRPRPTDRVGEPRGGARTQPPWFAALLGQHFAVPVERAAGRPWRRALRRRPADLGATDDSGRFVPDRSEGRGQRVPDGTRRQLPRTRAVWPPITTWDWPSLTGRTTTAPSRSSRRPSDSTPNTRPPAITSGTLWREKKNPDAPSPRTRRFCESTRRTHRLTTTWGWP